MPLGVIQEKLTVDPSFPQVKANSRWGGREEEEQGRGEEAEEEKGRGRAEKEEEEEEEEEEGGGRGGEGGRRGGHTCAEQVWAHLAAKEPSKEQCFVAHCKAAKGLRQHTAAR